MKGGGSFSPQPPHPPSLLPNSVHRSTRNSNSLLENLSNTQQCRKKGICLNICLRSNRCKESTSEANQMSSVNKIPRDVAYPYSFSQSVRLDGVSESVRNNVSKNKKLCAARNLPSISVANVRSLRP